MTTLSRKAEFKILRQGDPDFSFWDGDVLINRAGFECNPDAPEGYKLIMMECIKNGWIKPVAYMMHKEYVWEQLSK